MGADSSASPTEEATNVGGSGQRSSLVYSASGYHSGSHAAEGEGGSELLSVEGGGGERSATLHAGATPKGQEAVVEAQYDDRDKGEEDEHCVAEEGRGVEGGEFDYYYYSPQGQDGYGDPAAASCESGVVEGEEDEGGAHDDAKALVDIFPTSITNSKASSSGVDPRHQTAEVAHRNSSGYVHTPTRSTPNYARPVQSGGGGGNHPGYLSSSPTTSLTHVDAKMDGNSGGGLHHPHIRYYTEAQYQLLHEQQIYQAERMQASSISKPPDPVAGEDGGGVGGVVYINKGDSNARGMMYTGDGARVVGDRGEGEGEGEGVRVGWASATPALCGDARVPDAPSPPPPLSSSTTTPTSPSSVSRVRHFITPRRSEEDERGALPNMHLQEEEEVGHYPIHSASRADHQFEGEGEAGAALIIREVPERAVGGPHQSSLTPIEEVCCDDDAAMERKNRVVGYSGAAVVTVMEGGVEGGVTAGPPHTHAYSPPLIAQPPHREPLLQQQRHEMRRTAPHRDDAPQPQALGSRHSDLLHLSHSPPSVHHYHARCHAGMAPPPHVDPSTPCPSSPPHSQTTHHHHHPAYTTDRVHHHRPAPSPDEQ